MIRRHYAAMPAADAAHDALALRKQILRYAIIVLCDVASRLARVSARKRRRGGRRQ